MCQGKGYHFVHICSYFNSNFLLIFYIACYKINPFRFLSIFSFSSSPFLRYYAGDSGWIEWVKYLSTKIMSR
jgi:hypothetical protein